MKRSEDIREFSIDLPKLKNGVNEFHFEVGEKFFKHFEPALADRGAVSIDLEIRKTLNQLDAHFRIQGTVELNCDRCTLPYQAPVASEKRIIYAYPDAGVQEEEGMDDEVIYLDPRSPVLDISQDVYDFVCLEIPIRKVPEHCGEDCPNDPLKKLKAEGKIGEAEESEPTDPRWEALRKLQSDSNN